MKATATVCPSLTELRAAPGEQAAVATTGIPDAKADTARPTAPRSAACLLRELTKARLTLLVVLTNAVGFLVGSPGTPDLGLLLHSVLGTSLLASGASALNQWLERDLDALMLRTRNRPLPSGEMRSLTALALGTAAAILGVLYLAVAVNPVTSLLGLFTVVTYLFLYTPLKRITPLNTIVGALPGAMPPLMGATAATGGFSAVGWSLFAIQFFWQMPHFLAIAWLYREDYARAGFRMLPVVDPTGEQCGHQAISHALGLLIASLAPFALGAAGSVYLVAALGLGTGFLALAARFAGRLTPAAARALFLGSIAYLPLLLGLMVWDKAK